MMTIDWGQVVDLFETMLSGYTLRPITNRAARYPGAATSIDLTAARTDVSLALPGDSLTVVTKGNGAYSFKLVLSDASTCEMDSTEINAGDSWEIEFSDITFTNAAQPGLTGPSFYYAWRE